MSLETIGLTSSLFNVTGSIGLASTVLQCPWKDNKARKAELKIERRQAEELAGLRAPRHEDDDAEDPDEGQAPVAPEDEEEDAEEEAVWAYGAPPYAEGCKASGMTCFIPGCGYLTKKASAMCLHLTRKCSGHAAPPEVLNGSWLWDEKRKELNARKAELKIERRQAEEQAGLLAPKHEEGDAEDQDEEQAPGAPEDEEEDAEDQHEEQAPDTPEHEEEDSKEPIVWAYGAPPYTEGCKKDGMTCFIPGCSYKADKAIAMCYHLTRKSSGHAAPQEALEGSWLWEEKRLEDKERKDRLRQQRASAAPQRAEAPPAPAQAQAAAPTLWRPVMARCDAFGNLLQPLEVQDVLPAGGRSWVADAAAPPSASAVPPGSASPAPLPSASSAPVAPPPAPAVPPGSALVAQTPPSASAPMAPARGSLQATICREAQEFKLVAKEDLEKSLARRIYAWPCPATNVDLTGFENYVCSRVKKHATAEIYVRGVQHWLGAFHVEPAGASALDVYKHLYTSALISNVMVLPLWDASLSWTDGMRGGMLHFTDWLAGKAEDMGDTTGFNQALSFKRRWLSGMKHMIAAGKTTRTARRKAIDTARRLKLPSVPQQHKGVNDALIDIEILARENANGFQVSGCLAPGVRRALNAALAGVFAYRTYPGRPGELQLLPLSKLRKVVNDPEAWMYEVQIHKTADSHGVLGRYVPPELKEALRWALQLATKDQARLFVSGKGAGAGVAVRKAAIDFAKVYTPGTQYPEPTLLRKHVETEIAASKNAERANKMNQLIPAQLQGQLEASIKMAATAGHSLGTADKFYILESGNPERMAHTAKAYVNAFKGPLPDLTQEQRAAKLHRTTTDIIADLNKLAKRVLTPGEKLQKSVRLAVRASLKRRSSDFAEKKETKAATKDKIAKKDKKEKRRCNGEKDKKAKRRKPDGEEEEEEAGCSGEPAGAGAASSSSAAAAAAAPPPAAPSSPIDASLAAGAAAAAAAADGGAAAARGESRQECLARFQKERRGMGKARNPVSPAAKMWIDMQVKAWRLEYYMQWSDFPLGADWPYMKRLEAIKEGLLTDEHHPDVVRSHINAQKNKRKDNAAPRLLPDQALALPWHGVPEAATKTIMSREDLEAMGRAEPGVFDDHMRLVPGNPEDLRTVGPPRMKKGCVLKVPPDGLCFVYCFLAAQDPDAWQRLVLDDDVGYIADRAADEVQKAKAEAIQSQVMERLHQAGKFESVERLAKAGEYPGLDEFPFYAAVFECAFIIVPEGDQANAISMAPRE